MFVCVYIHTYLICMPHVYALYVRLIYAYGQPIVCHWCWDPNGWLTVMGFHDFAGRQKKSPSKKKFPQCPKKFSNVHLCSGYVEINLCVCVCEHMWRWLC